MAGATAQAFAFTACTAAEVIAQEPNCPSNPALACNIRSVVTVPTGQNCLFDFGSRALVIGSGSGTTGAGRFQFGSSVVGIKAGSLTVNANGLLEGVGASATPPNSRGGMISLDVAGDVNFLGGAAVLAVDLKGRSEGGVLTVNTGGNFTQTSRVDASNSTMVASGGIVRITAQNVTIGGSIVVSGGIDSAGGGEIDIKASNRIEVTGTLDISGSDGGALALEAQNDIVIANISGQGTGGAGSGGTATLAGRRGVTITGLVQLSGNVSTGLGGGCGGFLCLEAPLGTVALAASSTVRAEGADPDGGGGEIDLVARRDITLGTGVLLSARGGGPEGCGGGICLESDRDIDVATSARGIDVSGGSAGGDLTATAGRNLVMRAGMNLTGRNEGGTGGTLILEAGLATSGNLEVRSSLNVGGGVCGPEFGCGAAGTADLTACNLGVFAGGGEVRARAPNGGQITLTARRQLSIAGPVTSAKTSASEPDPGTVSLKHPTSFPPTIGSGQVQPAPTVVPLPACTSLSQEQCLLPCPTCGNGAVEFPETCDTLGTPANCDGCSEYCRTENCDDGLLCTNDSCELALGCIHTPANTPCVEPSATPTPSPTQTATRTRTATATHTATATPSASVTRTATATATAPPVPCPGDCDGNQTLSPSDISRAIAIVNLCGGNASGCPAVPGGDQQCILADLNQDGVIRAAEVSRLVANAIQYPDGCPP